MLPSLGQYRKEGLTLDKSTERSCSGLAVMVGTGGTCELVEALLLLGSTRLEVLVVLLADGMDTGAPCDGRESIYMTK